MAKTILIDPVTRIEGHAKVTVRLTDDGQIADARLHITQLRGFEKFCENRPFYEMPSLMARICGICPVSHLIASSKACDAILGVNIPANAARLRRILNLAQILQSHALSVFHLSSPDLILGMDAPPEKRHLFGVAASAPEVARDGIRLRQIGQQIIEILGGKRIHPAWVVPGGVTAPLTEEKHAQIRAMLPDGLAALDRTLGRFRGLFQCFPEEVQSFANFPSLFLGLTDGFGHLEYYDGPLRLVGADGNVVANGLRPADYPNYIGEVAESDSYLKSAYYRPLGYPNGIYRVGPLARLNLVTSCGTPLADHELGALRAFAGSPLLSSFHYHQARLIEMLHVIERMQDLLAHPDILSPHVRAFAEPNQEEGVGISEAPRGTLLHHYKVDRNGLIRWANLIIATGHNNLAMNRGIKQTAAYFVRDGQLSEGALNRVEAVIRAFDPCLSCSTHAAGQMPLEIHLLDSTGALLDSQSRVQ
jgi:NAD-reducing hydrogenase large subunit